MTCELLTRLRNAGLTLTADGDVLHVSPASRLNDEFRAVIRSNKPALLAALRHERELVAEAKRLYDELARRHGWPDSSWQEDAPTIAKDLNGAVQTLRNLTTEKPR